MRCGISVEAVQNYPIKPEKMQITRKSNFRMISVQKLFSISQQKVIKIHHPCKLELERAKVVFFWGRQSVRCTVQR